ncbi:MAG: hypothetical protein ACFFD4_24045 [Candidatus Odinarchaeota archaeon]
MNDTINELQFLVGVYQLSALLAVRTNNIGVDYKRIVEGFQELEKITGPLDVFNIPEYLPSDHRKNILEFRLRENQMTVKNALEFFRAGYTISEPENILQKIMKDLLGIPDRKLIDYYLEYFELLYENVIVPVVDVTAPPPPKGRFRHSYDYQITFVRNFLEEKGLKDALDYFLMTLSGKLRNALVHQSYYIKGDKLIYYTDNPRKGKAMFDEKSLEEFRNEVTGMLAMKLLFLVVSGIRLLNLSPEQLDELIKRKE